MKRRRMFKWAGGGLLGMFLLAGGGEPQARAQQPGVAQGLGQRLDDVGRTIRRGAIEIGETMRRGFETMKSEVNRMTVAARVYSRIHWDRALNEAKIEVHPIRGGGILLSGTVADQAARDRAVMLARDTVEVTEVLDELTVLTVTTTPAVSPARNSVPAPAPASPSR